MILIKLFYFDIACQSIFYLVLILILQAITFTIFFICLVWFITSLTKRIRSKIFVHAITTTIPLITFLLINQIDSEKVDFYLHLKEREAVISAIQSNQLKVASDGTLSGSIVTTTHKKIVLLSNNSPIIVAFWRCYIGFGDGYKAFIYRSDSKDISISPQDYRMMYAKDYSQIFERTGIKETPSYLEIRKMAEHWFWQVVSY